MKNDIHSTVGDLTKWLLSLVAVHLLADIVYAMTLGGMIMDQLENDNFVDAYNTIFIFGIAVMALFAIYYTTMLCRDVDMKNDIKAYMKEKKFSLLGFFKDRCLKMTVYRMIVFLIWHVPVIIMYPTVTLGPVILTFWGRLWIVEAGSIGVTGSVILGVLINLLVMTVVYVLSLLIGIHFLHKDIKENSFT